jgi:hypothetical protein
MILNLKVVLKGESPIALEASVTADIGRSANTSRGGPADPKRWGPVTLRRRFTPTLPKIAVNILSRTTIRLVLR